jgi:hypothetical protein
MPKVQIKSARTMKSDPSEAAEELVNSLGGIEPKLVTLFASCMRDQRALNKAVRERLPKTTRLIGATSSAEIDHDGLHQGSVVLGALSGDFEVGLGLGQGLSLDAISAGVEAVAKASAELGVRPADLSPRRHIGLVIDDASKMKKEELLLGMLEKNQSLLLVGGGASDWEMDPQKQKHLLHVDGEVVDDAALIALFSTQAPFAALRSHWFEPTGRTIKLTKLDDSHTRVFEIDGKPAALRYAEILDIPPSDLDLTTPQGSIRGWGTMPTALKVGREYFIRSPMLRLPDESILFANLLEEGTELELMKRGDMADITRRFFEQEVPKRVNSPQAALLFNCGARHWSAQATGALDDIAATFRCAPPCAGFNVHFEIYCGFHINTTLTALVFGETQ